MIKILVADDDSKKTGLLIKLFSTYPEVSYDTVSAVNNAKDLLTSNQYDLLILDLCLPNRFGQDPSPENGLNFLQAIETAQRIIKPFHIIGLTAYDNLLDEFSNRFNDYLWSLIHFKESNTRWEQQIKSKLDYLIKSKQSILRPQNAQYLYDLAIITALRDPELARVLDLTDWESFKIENDPTPYFKGVFKNSTRSINVVAASATQMGMVATTTLSIKMIEHFRPKYLAMTGIAGGIMNKGNLGDIIIAESAFDYGSGKIRTDPSGNRIFEPDYRPIEISAELKEEFIACKADRFQLDLIKANWKGPKPNTSLELIIGPLGSGAGVVEYKGLVDEIKGHSRKLVGIDMETYGLYYAATHCPQPRPLGMMALKSISDFANPDKNDDFQLYAAYTSCQFLFYFALNKLNFNSL